MASDTIPISDSVRSMLIELSDRTGRPAAELLEAAVQSFRQSLVARQPVDSIPGVDPADVWQAAGQADAGLLTPHADLFARLRARS